VATVNDEPITLKELTKTLAASHEKRSEGEQVGKEDYLTVLNRLITTKLVVTEGKNMGLDELPDVKEAVDVHKERLLRDLLKQRQIKDVTPDAEDVERFYKEAVKEYKIKSVLFEKEDSAKKAEDELTAGKDFDEFTKGLVESGELKDAKEGQYVKPKDLLPQVQQVLSTMAVGSTSPVIDVSPSAKEQKFTIIKLEDIRYPDDPEARESAREQALTKKKGEVLVKYVLGLGKKYVKVDYKLLKSIDYESGKTSFQKLLKDKRPLIRIKGEKPVTVGELTEAIQKQLFHGPEEAIKSKKINEWKNVYQELLQQRILRKEALKEGIDKTEEYKTALKDYRDSLIFGLFVEKVIFPGVKLKEEEVRNYYNEHTADYASPEMMRINSIAFTKKEYAEDAIGKLRKGTDFSWLLANAEGRADKDIKDLLVFQGDLLVTKSLPDGVRESISGAKKGDLRLFAGPDNYYYVLSVKEVVPAVPLAFDEVKTEIAKKIFDEKTRKSMDDWAEKLKKVYPVKIYASNK